MEEQKKKSSKLPFILIGCGAIALLGVAIVGILAAIAVPAFMRFTNQAKGAEAQFTVLAIANSAASYYMQECKFPPSAAPTSPVPTGGESASTKFSGPGWDELSLSMASEMFFSYRTQTKGDVLTVIGEADFRSGPPFHTVTIEVRGTKDASSFCSAEVGELKTTHELE